MINPNRIVASLLALGGLLLCTSCTSTPAEKQESALHSLAQDNPKAIIAPDMTNTLVALKATRDAGNLTETEYVTARGTAINNELHLITADPRFGPGFVFSADWLHDETSYLSGLKSQGLLSISEFEKLRAAILGLYTAQK